MKKEKNTFCLFGASRVGVSLAFHLCRIGLVPEYVWNRSEKGLNRAVEWVPFNKRFTSIEECNSRTDWMVISVSDDSIKYVCNSISKLNIQFDGIKVFHTSGFHSSDILKELELKGCETGSLHPVISVPDIHTGIEKMPSSVYTCEGEIRDQFCDLVTKIGGQGVKLSSRQKESVHIAAVFLSNYNLVLINAIKKLCDSEGVSSDETKLILKRLSMQAIDNGWEKTLEESLTGPISRGDAETVGKHIEFLKNNPELLSLYREYGTLTTKVVEESNILSEDLLRQILTKLKE